MAVILHIDDEESVLRAVKRKLKQSKHTVHTAVNGEKGLRIAKEKKIDCILLDIILPTMDGQEVLAAFRRDPKTKNIPIIIFSNVESPAEIIKSKKAGAIEFLTKTNSGLGDVANTIDAVTKKRKKK